MNRLSNIQSQSVTRRNRLLEALAWLLPLTLAAGSDFAVFEWVGISWYAYRVVIFLIAIIALADAILVKRKLLGWQIALLLFLVVWILWSIVHRPLGIEPADWSRGVFYISVAAATLWSFYYLAITGMQKILVHASVAGFMVNAIVSFVQMLTSIRPQSAFATELSNYSSEHFVRFEPSGMFGNPNHFAFYLCAQLLLVYTFRQHLSFTLRAVLYVLGALLILFTQSRIAMAAATLLSVLMIIENWNWLRIQAARIARPFGFTIIFLMALLFTTQWVNTRAIALAQEAARGELVQIKSSGDAGRMSLIQCGLEMLKVSNYGGVGAGQFEHAAQVAGCQTGGMKNPHCGFMELAAESGIVVLALLVLFILLFLNYCRRNGVFLKALAWAGMLCLLQFANSTFISIPIAWCFMAWPFLITYAEKEEIT